MHPPVPPRGRRGPAAIAAACAALLAATAASLMLGSVHVGFSDLLAVLGPGGGASSGGDSVSAAARIVTLVRLPRTVTAIGVGSALGLAGLVMQTVFRNALAGPGVLGVTAGAGLGVAAVLLAGVGASIPGLTAVAAMVGAGLVLVLALTVNRIVGQPVFLLVLGLLFGYAASSITTLLMAAAPGEGLERYVVWSFGSFALPPGAAPWVILAAAGATTAALTVAAPRVDALLLGPQYAESIGIHARRLHGTLILLAGTLTGLVTAFTGPIVFLGVAVPHIARGVVRSSRHRILVPMTALTGASLALVADIAARLPGSDRVLPLNSVMALVGVPVVLAVILRAQPEATEELGL